MMTAALSDIAHLSVAERIQLAEDIWDTVVASPEDVRLSEARIRELEQRLTAYRQNPDAGDSWQEIQQSVEGKLRS